MANRLGWAIDWKSVFILERSATQSRMRTSSKCGETATAQSFQSDSREREGLLTMWNWNNNCLHRTATERSIRLSCRREHLNSNLPQDCGRHGLQRSECCHQ